MFALMNPPHVKHRKGRKTAKNSWFGNTEGHRAAAKKGWGNRRKKHGKKIPRASALRTPGGGRIFSIAANPKPFWPRIRHNSFMGVNPHISPSPSRSHTMARKRRTRFNLGFSSPKRSGSIFDAFKPNNLVGVTPILGGVVLNGIVAKFLSEKIPYTRKGIGNIVLGLASAGGLGMLAKYANKQMGDGVFVGGVVGTLGCAFQNFMADGMKSLSLSGAYDSFTDHGFNGMGTFVSPQQVSSAMPSEGMISQYSLPATNAQFSPGMHAQLAPPQTPMQHSQTRGISDYDGGAIGAVLGQDDAGGMMGV